MRFAEQRNNIKSLELPSKVPKPKIPFIEKVRIMSLNSMKKPSLPNEDLEVTSLSLIKYRGQLGADFLAKTYLKTITPHLKLPMPIPK